MRERQRRHEREQNATAGGGEDEDSIDAVRQAAEDFLAAGDEAIDRALSGDSRQFLRANRQQGGQ